MKDFILGCNYWASNAGTDMWRDWSEEAVRDDLEILTAHGVTHLRVFINWRDFQPVMPVLGVLTSIAEYCMEGDRAPENPYYLDETILKRFERFCDICEEYGLQLIVGLVTGWMSGRSFIPSALYGKNLSTDSLAISMQLRLVKGVVERVREKKAILAWDLGNECNCLVNAQNRDAAYAWTGIIANTIRASDPSRPVVSGMHSLKAADRDVVWTIEDQAQFCDILTTHPYPYFVDHAYKDNFASFRTLNHATCETKYYADLGEKPCLVEEIGTLGPMLCSDQKAADFLRVNLLSNWINGAKGVMWWCANEQTNLTAQPYTRCMCEIELGMIDASRTPKPVLLAMKRFAEEVKMWDIDLPEAREDAVCILTSGQDQWGTAYMTWCLAKQVSMNLRFCYANRTIPESKVYLLPSLCGTNIMPREIYLELKQRVREGAVLYISNDNGLLAEFSELTGLKTVDSGMYHQERTVTVGGTEIPFVREQYFQMEPVGAQILSYDSEEDPAVTVYSYGKGRVYYVNFPLEFMLTKENEAFDKGRHLIYEQIFGDILSQREAQIDNPLLSLTFHPAEDGSLYCAIMNYSTSDQKTNLKLKEGYQITEVVTGSLEMVEACGMTLFRMERSM